MSVKHFGIIKFFALGPQFQAKFIRSTVDIHTHEHNRYTITHLAHGCYKANILEGLPVEVLPTIIHPSLLQEQLEKSNRLLGAILVNLSIHDSIWGRGQSVSQRHTHI